MATIQHSNDSSTVDALWTLISQQTENVKRELAERLADSLSPKENKVYPTMEEALSLVKTLSVKSENVVPIDENKRYSPRITRLRNLCGRNISKEELQSDDRLNYLLNK